MDVTPVFEQNYDATEKIVINQRWHKVKQDILNCSTICIVADDRVLW